MAKGKVDDKQQQPAAEADGKQSSKKLIVIIALVVVLAIGVAAGVTWYLLGNDSAEASVAGEAVPSKEPAAYFKFREPLVVTFNVANRQRFLQAHITLLMRQTGVYDGLELHMPVIQNRLLNVFGEQDFMVVQTHAGRLELQEKAKEAINLVLAEQNIEGAIERVLFTNLVMQ